MNSSSCNVSSSCHMKLSRSSTVPFKLVHFTNLRPCVVPLISGLMTGHRPTSCAPQSLGSHISSADPEGSVLGTYGTVSTVKVLPDGQISTPFRFLTFTSIQHGFLERFPLINIQCNTCAHTQNARIWLAFFVSGWYVHMLTSLNRNERSLVGRRSRMCQTLHKSAREVLSPNTRNN